MKADDLAMCLCESFAECTSHCLTLIYNIKKCECQWTLDAPEMCVDIVLHDPTEQMEVTVILQRSGEVEMLFLNFISIIKP